MAHKIINHPISSSFDVFFYFQAAKKSQKFYHGDEVAPHMEETKELNDVEKSDPKKQNEDSRLSFSDFSKYQTRPSSMEVFILVYYSAIHVESIYTQKILNQKNS